MWAKWCTKWNVKHFTTPIYHPQANPTERRNQEIKKGLRLALLNQDHRTWDQYISPIIFNLRRRLNRITGQTPSYVLLGRTLPRPGEHETYDVHSQSRFEEVRKSQARNAPVIRTESDKYKIGDFVYVRDHELSSTRKHFCAGLGPRWIGPFKVVERYNTDVYGILRPPGDVVKVHVNDMRRSMITEVDESGNEIPELPPQQPPDLTPLDRATEEPTGAIEASEAVRKQKKGRPSTLEVALRRSMDDQFRPETKHGYNLRGHSR